MGQCFSTPAEKKKKKYEVQDSAPNSPEKPARKKPAPSSSSSSEKKTDAALTATSKTKTKGGGSSNNKKGAPQLSPVKPKLDPKDFLYVNRRGERLCKPPGSVDGQQFVIDGCEDCEIYILDHCDSVTIDDCKRCVVVIGPTEGSIFIRDSEDCKCVFMCRQYRSRDCVNVDTHLHVTTRPIIETSANMRFACFDFHYDKLEAQMATAGISRFQNFWSHVFNFNPETHATWSLMDPKITAFSQLIGGADGTGAELPDFPALEGVSEALKDGAAPPSCCRTWGEREPPAAATGDGDLGTSTGGGARDGCLILIPAADAKMAGELLQMADAAKVLLMRTNDCQLSEPWLRTFLTEGGVAANEVAKLAKQLSTGRAIGLEFGGDGCADAMRGVANSGGFAMLEDPDQYAEWRYMGVEG